MIGAHQLAPRRAPLFKRSIGSYAQNRIGQRRCIGHKPRPKRGKVAVIHRKNLRHPHQERIFIRVVHAVGHGDVEQPFDQIVQHLGLVRKHLRNACGVILETGHIMTRQIEHPRRTLLVGLGDLEHFAKGGNFVAGHLPVGLGHLGPQGNHGNGEGHRPFRRGAQTVENSRQPLTGGER